MPSAAQSSTPRFLRRGRAGWLRLGAVALGLAVLGTACGGGSGGEAPVDRFTPKKDRDKARAAKKGSKDKARAAGPKAQGGSKAAGEPQGAEASAPAGPPGLVMLVVLDTVRADHLAVCGYDRPTSPVLRELAGRDVAASCHAYSPAPWTLPSHASYFTGLDVTEHGLVLAPESALAVNPNVNVRPLDPSVDTLAERFQARGYQTAFLSGNPIIKAETGLHQGFDVAVSAEPQGGGLRGKALARRLGQLLDDLDPDAPTFLFVNVYDAHDPYPAIPKAVKWLPPREALRISPTKRDPSNDFFRFHEGRMSEAEAARWLEHVRDTYDWGIHEADETLGRVMDVVKDKGFTDRGVRFALTADHGELLGEHGHLRHGGYLHEGVVRVPLLYFDSTAPQLPELPDPVSATQVFPLLLRGETDPLLGVPRSVSTKNPSFFQVGVRSAAVWLGRDKGVWQAGDTHAFDLQADPAEAQPGPVPEGGRMEATLSEAAEDYAAMEALPVPDDADMTEALRAMGYVE